MSDQKWADYDVARHTFLMRINDVSNALYLEEEKDAPDRTAIANLEAELDDLDLKSSLISAENFSR